MADFRVTVSGEAVDFILFRADRRDLPKSFAKNRDNDWQTTVRGHPDDTDGFLNLKLIAVGPADGVACKMSVVLLTGSEASDTDESSYDRRLEAILWVDLPL